MLEKLKAQPWHIQLLLLVGIASVAYFAVYYFVTSETRTEIAALNDQVAQLTAKNEAAKIATQRINEFRTLYASKSAEYDELKVLLPEQREITNVLQGLQSTAGESRLIVNRFSPREDVAQDSMMAKPVEIEVDSNFNNSAFLFRQDGEITAHRFDQRFQTESTGQTIGRPHFARAVFADDLLRRAGKFNACAGAGTTGCACAGWSNVPPPAAAPNGTTPPPPPAPVAK